MKTIYLVRHGHVDNPDHIFYNEHFPLSAIGTREATELAHLLKENNCAPARILSSPYLRARETAHVISSVIDGPEVEHDDRLMEWQVGTWFLKPLAEFRSYAGYDKKPFVPNTEGFENFETMSARVKAAILDLARSINDGGCGIIVSHREPMVSAILSFQGLGWDQVPLLDFPKGSSWRLTFDETSAMIDAHKAFDAASIESINGI